MPKTTIVTNLTTTTNGRARSIESDSATEVQFHATTPRRHIRVRMTADGALLVQVLNLAGDDWSRGPTIELGALDVEPSPVTVPTIPLDAPHSAGASR